MTSKILQVEVVVLLLILMLVTACARGPSTQPSAQPAPAQAANTNQSGDQGAGVADHEAGDQAEVLPQLSAVKLESGQKLRVVATTNIVADVVANIGGDLIELTPLMPVGADPHSFTPTPQDLRTLNDAHAIFMNGLGLEESLLPILENLDTPVPLVSVNAGIEPLAMAEDEHKGEEQSDHHQEGADPHTWFSVPNVAVWVDNIAGALSALDPEHAEDFAAAAAGYKQRLHELDSDIRTQVQSIPEDQRKLVTDHEAFGYLAHEYGLELVGSVLPSLSTLAAASAKELAALQENMKVEAVRALFVSSTVNPQTATQVAGDLGIPVVTLYVGSLSDAQGPAPSYIDLMEYDVAQIVAVLR